jgi:hypothetical protein
MAFVFGNCNLTFSPSSCSKPSISVHGIPILGNVTVGTQFSSILLKRSCSFDNRLNKFGVTFGNLANGEVKASSREISSIEQELNFRPNFSDYVKIMESVKLDRSNISDVSSDNNSSKRTKKQTSLKRLSLKTNDDNYIEEVQPKQTKGKSGGWNQVESILLDKKLKINDRFGIKKSKSNLNEKYERKGDSFGKIGGTIGDGVRNKNAKEKFAQQKAYENGQQERFYQEKKIKLENHGTDAIHEKSKEKYGVVKREHEKYQRKSESFGKIGATIGESVRNNTAKENFPRQKTHDNGLQERFHQERETKLKNYGTVAMHEKSEENYGVVRREHGKYQRVSDSPGDVSGTIFRSARNNNAKEKFVQQKACDNDQQKRFYQQKETKFGNFGTVAAHEKSKEKYSRVVRREHDEIIGGKNNSVIEPMFAQEDKKLEGYDFFQVEQKCYQRTGAQLEKAGVVKMQEKAKQRCNALIINKVTGKYIDERAAFKTFEVFTDIRNRPRVLRMEMEERIRKLAAR